MIIRSIELFNVPVGPEPRPEVPCAGAQLCKEQSAEYFHPHMMKRVSKMVE